MSPLLWKCTKDSKLLLKMPLAQPAAALSEMFEMELLAAEKNWLEFELQKPTSANWYQLNKLQ